jgi:hypothetical protein
MCGSAQSRQKFFASFFQKRRRLLASLECQSGCSGAGVYAALEVDRYLGGVHGRIDFAGFEAGAVDDFGALGFGVEAGGEDNVGGFREVGGDPGGPCRVVGWWWGAEGHPTLRAYNDGWVGRSGRQMDKSFLLLFFKKEGACFLTWKADQAAAGRVFARRWRWISISAVFMAGSTLRGLKPVPSMMSVLWALA